MCGFTIKVCIDSAASIPTSSTGDWGEMITLLKATDCGLITVDDKKFVDHHLQSREIVKLSKIDITAPRHAAYLLSSDTCGTIALWLGYV